MLLRFEWHTLKAAANLIKHGVTFEEAKTVFGDRNLYTEPDPEHSDDEVRFVSVGLSTPGRLLTVCHTEVENLVRIISARQATRREATYYRSFR